MLVKTNRNFYDLKDDTYRKVGDKFEVSKARFDELNELVAGFIEEVKEIKEDAAADEVETPEVNEEVETEIQEDLTVAEIKEKLDEAGIEYKAKATKSELLELLK